MSLRTLDVALGGRSYPIHVGAGLLARPELWRAAVDASHILIVSDEAVATQYLAPVKAALEGARVGTLVLPPGEASKSLANLERVFEALAALGAGRDACLVALGGGVIGDLTGFAAATWMRGVDFIQVPTTLLAMVDSSVGGKTAVNLAAGKNLVGAFHQPRLVVADTATLETLPPREYRAGLAEVVKYGAIGDAAFFAWLEEHAAALAAADPALLAEAIERSCAHKAAVVARDEHEQGERALLNFGHTFGHAYEALAGYDGRLLHGEAVAFGMVQAARLSAQLGRADAADAQRLAALLETLGLPVVPPGYPPAAVLERMMLDKKNRRGRLRLVLWRGIGRAEVVDGVADSDVLQALQA